MAVVTTKSTAITNLDATPIVQNTPQISRGRRAHSVATVAVANGDSINSQYRMFRVRSGDRIATLSLFCGAITGAAANLGLYDINGGAAVVSPTYGSGAAACLASAQSLASALNGTNITYSVTTLAQAEKRVWELLGFTSDPGKEYDVTFTLTAAATAAGQLVLHMDSVSNG
jgi:hypothetical protein